MLMIDNGEGLKVKVMKKEERASIEEEVRRR
jgi:hypothetical protein